MSETQTDSAPETGPSAGETLLKQLLEEHIKIASLQADYQAVSRALPTALAAGGEAARLKQAGEQAYESGLAAAERVVQAAADIAGQLAASMQAEHATLLKLVKDEALLGQIASAAAQTGLAASGQAGVGQAGAGTSAAGQLNATMGALKAALTQEVERQIGLKLAEMGERLRRMQARVR